jgi:hypothetical protein
MYLTVSDKKNINITATKQQFISGITSEIKIHIFMSRFIRFHENVSSYLLSYIKIGTYYDH